MDKGGTVRGEDYTSGYGKKWIIKKYDRDVWIGLIWLRIGTDGRRL